MRIAVNLLPFREQLAGAGRYTHNILRELIALDSENEYIFFVASRAAEHFAYASRNITRVCIALPASSAVRIAYEQLVLPLQLSRHKVGLLFTPSVAIPIAWRGKRVTVIYDMIAEHRAVTKYTPLRSAYVRWMSRYSARTSVAVITNAETSRREIAHYAQVPLEKIALAYSAPDPALHPIREAETLAQVRESYGLPEQFVLYLGTLEPGKNLPRLIRAYARMRREHPELEHHLVIAGARGWRVAELEREIQRSDAEGFQLLGFVQNEDLAALYSLADLFVYPSLYEGFALPPVEAMACGTPVVVSNVSALPEILGEPATGKMAGLLVSPYDEHALAEAMALVLGDRALHQELGRLGLERAAHFSWRASAGVVSKVLNSFAIRESQ
jgi:glycosyltransferase involved in cell wall biosynthesis